jgi:hypothetical protein
MSTKEHFDVTSEPATMIRIKKMWEIDAFMQLKESSDSQTFITSKPFSSDLWPDCVWQLRMYPSSLDDDCCDTNDHIQWNLSQVGTPEINAKFKVCLVSVGALAQARPTLDEDGCMLQVYCLENDKTEDSTHFGSHIFKDGQTKVVGGRHYKDPESALRASGELVTVCELEYFRPIKLCSHEVGALEGRDFGKLYRHRSESCRSLRQHSCKVCTWDISFATRPSR